MFVLENSEPSWGYWIRTIAPIIGLILIPLLTHLYTSFRDRSSRLISIISTVEECFDDINKHFFESVTQNNKSEELSEQIKDAVREQQVIIAISKVNTLCQRAVELTHNLDIELLQREVAPIRKYATHDKFRELENFTESTRLIIEAQNTILKMLGQSKVKKLFIFI